ncbi:unnamed protein product [Orchesella dallaii]|uniref:Kinase n=1 Tax=Orchesella dallaii TaxID=48710 RepID=A0ABP1RAF7_9HEXA
MFPPVQCSKSSYFTQWLISEYLNRISNESSDSVESTTPPPPPPQRSSPPREKHSHFSAKHLNLFFNSSTTAQKLTRANNNEYKNGVSSSSPESSPKNIEFIQLLALNALEFTAPIYSFINKKQEKKHEPTSLAKCPSTRSFVQLSGHPGSFAPAGPNTVWKKMPDDHAVCPKSSNIDSNISLRDLLGSLDPPTTAPASSPDNALPTTPITVFFKSENTPSPTTSSSSSTPSTPPLLPPQIYEIPTHVLPNECQVYRRVTSALPPDPITKIIPKYVTETCYNSQMFLELEDLLTNFTTPNPSIMDIKLGSRTFLESEVKNSKPRPDLYEKLIAVDPTACTEEEHDSKAVTKLTYMLFREKQSSSNSLGFRVEGVKIGENGVYKGENQLDVNFKCLKTEDSISNVFMRFFKGNNALIEECIVRLEFIKHTLEQSEFFATHEVIGSSLLFIHDDKHAGIWMIDFAKTFYVENGRLSHRSKWLMGNREDGVLTGVDNIIHIFRNYIT